MERKNNVKLLLAVPLEQEVLSASWALFFVLSIAAVAAAPAPAADAGAASR